MIGILLLMIMGVWAVLFSHSNCGVLWLESDRFGACLTRVCSSSVFSEDSEARTVAQLRCICHTPQLRDTESNNMVGSMSVEEWKEQVSEQLTKAYGSSINADYYQEIFESWGTANDNDFWESLLDKIPHRFLQTWKD